MKKAVLFLLLICQHVYGQVNPLGVPFITNYSAETFGAASMNWAVVQNQQGIMYFGNEQNGVLEYDGVSWRQIPTNLNTTIRSLSVDEKGTVYVGAIGEFGYLYPNNRGMMLYRSLSDSLPVFQDVWQTFNYNDKIIFNTTRNLYIYKNLKLDSIIPLPRTSFFAFNVNNNILISNMIEGLFRLQPNYNLVPIKGSSNFSSKRIFSILPYDKNQLLITTANKGVFLFDTITRKILNPDFLQQASRFGEHYQLYNTIKLNNSYLFSSLSNGCFQMQHDNALSLLLNSDLGLQSNTVTYAYQSNDNTIWLTLEQGISKIEYHSPFKLFDKKNGIEGWINDLQWFNNQLYVATALGIFCLEKDDEQAYSFRKIPSTDFETWDLAVFKPTHQPAMLLAASNNGLFNITNKSIQKLQITDNNDYFYTVETSKRPNTLYLGTQSTVMVLEWNNNDFVTTRIDTTDVHVRKIYETNDNKLWITTSFNGLILIDYEQNQKIHYNDFNGLPSLKYLWVFDYKNDIIVASPQGLYQFDSLQQQFVPYKRFGERYGNSSVAVKNISVAPDSSVWITVADKEGAWLEVLNARVYNPLWYNKEFHRLPKKAFSTILHDTSGVTWLSFEDKLYSFDNNLVQKDTAIFRTLVRKVTIISADSVLFGGTFFQQIDTNNFVTHTQSPFLIPHLQYEHNSIAFEFAAPYFNEEQRTLYSYRLMGFDSTWSRWTKETKAVYTNLYEGTYMFEVKAKNVYGDCSLVASYQFVIKPPFFRTMAAYLLYIIMLALLIYVMLTWNSARLRKQNQQLENVIQVRTAEVTQKNTELTQQALDLKKANDAIMLQKEEIQAKNKDITKSITAASRIQNAVLPPTHELNDVVADHFIFWQPRDIVSGDFYWIQKNEHNLIIAAADCTGHGVPGAFMSMLGIALLNEITRHGDNLPANQILNEIRNEIKTALFNTDNQKQAREGMDIALCIIDLNSYTMQYAGANNPLYIFAHNTDNTYKFSEIEPDYQPIGYTRTEKSFNNKTIQLKKGDVFYIFSDGYTSQFGGSNDETFKSARFKELLKNICVLPLNRQKEILEQTMQTWQGNYEQVDDMLVIGVKI